MAVVEGALNKMRSDLQQTVSYDFCVGDDGFALNQLIGSKISLQFSGNIFCVQCGRKTSKSFQQGHCFVCMKRINECGNCILYPERCLVEQGGCPEDDWAHAHCGKSHIVYLANSSGLKVGITRETQVPTRWIDQGAMQALPIFKVSNRYQSGRIEVAIKQHVSDRTNWRVMLTQDSVMMNLHEERDRLLDLAQKDLQLIMQDYSDDQINILDHQDVTSIQFPITQYPEKVRSLSLDKTPEVSGVLQGIKGQYLLFDTGVINVRKFSGYVVTVEY